MVRAALLAEGVERREHTDAVSLARDAAGVRVLPGGPGKGETLVGSHLLVAVGRRPGVDWLGLAKPEARVALHAVQTLAQPLAGTDRAAAERATERLIELVLGRRGRILGQASWGAMLARRSGREGWRSNDG